MEPHQLAQFACLPHLLVCIQALEIEMLVYIVQTYVQAFDAVLTQRNRLPSEDARRTFAH